MSRIIATRALRGANALVTEAETMLQQTLAEKGPDTPVAFPNTAYYLPLIFGMTGIEIETVGQLDEAMQHARALLHPVPSQRHWTPYLGETLDSGMATLIAAEVIEALTAETGWNHRTVRTLLRRLVDKGAVSYTEDGRAYLYAAVLSREAYVRSESRSFLDRVFGGNPLSALAHFVEDEDLSPEELARLQSMVDEKREELS